MADPKVSSSSGRIDVKTEMSDQIAASMAEIAREMQARADSYASASTVPAGAFPPGAEVAITALQRAREKLIQDLRQGSRHWRELAEGRRHAARGIAEAGSAAADDQRRNSADQHRERLLGNR